MNLDPLLIVEGLIRLLLTIGVITAILTVCVMALLLGVVALATRVVHHGRTTDEEEYRGLDLLDGREPE